VLLVFFLFQALPADMKLLIDNRGLLVEARNMLQQLDTISVALNSFQDDTSNLSDCTKNWLKLVADESILEAVRKDIKQRFLEVVTPLHLAAYVLDHRRRLTDMVRDPAATAGDENEVSQDPDLEPAMQEQVPDYFENKDDSFAAVLAAYEMQDVSVFPKTAFHPSMVNLSPDKYWKYLEKISALLPVKRFASEMLKIFSCPPSSAGIERMFSSAELIHTTTRNRLKNDRVSKLLKVYRYFRSERDCECYSSENNFSFVEDFE